MTTSSLSVGYLSMSLILKYDTFCRLLIWLTTIVLTFTMVVDF